LSGDAPCRTGVLYDRNTKTGLTPKKEAKIF
jgi:hypothetical protein